MSVIIRLQNLPWTANSVDIRQFFKGLLIPDGGVHIVGGDQGDAFIAFSSDEDARVAMMKTGGSLHGANVALLLSSRTEMQRVIETARQRSMAAQTLPPSIQQPAVSVLPPIHQQQHQMVTPGMHHQQSMHHHHQLQQNAPASSAAAANMPVAPTAAATGPAGPVTAQPVTTTSSSCEPDVIEIKQTDRRQSSDHEDDYRSRGSQRHRSSRSRSRSRDRSSGRDRRNRNRDRGRRNRSRSRDRNRRVERGSRRERSRSRDRDRRSGGREDRSRRSPPLVENSVGRRRSTPPDRAEGGLQPLRNKLQQLASGVKPTPPRAGLLGDKPAPLPPMPPAVSMAGAAELPTTGSSADPAISSSQQFLPHQGPPGMSAPPGSGPPTQSPAAMAGFRGPSGGYGAEGSGDRGGYQGGSRTPYSDAGHPTSGAGPPRPGYGNMNNMMMQQQQQPMSPASETAFCLQICNLSKMANYRDIRDLLRGVFVGTRAIKMINDENGLRLGKTYICLSTQQDRDTILQRSGRLVRGQSVLITPLDKEVFDAAVDSQHPTRDSASFSTAGQPPHTQSSAGGPPGSSAGPGAYHHQSNPEQSRFDPRRPDAAVSSPPEDPRSMARDVPAGFDRITRPMFGDRPNFTHRDQDRDVPERNGPGQRGRGAGPPTGRAGDAPWNHQQRPSRFDDPEQERLNDFEQEALTLMAEDDEESNVSMYPNSGRYAGQSVPQHQSRGPFGAGLQRPGSIGGRWDANERGGGAVGDPRGGPPSSFGDPRRRDPPGGAPAGRSGYPGGPPTRRHDPPGGFPAGRRDPACVVSDDPYTGSRMSQDEQHEDSDMMELAEDGGASAGTPSMDRAEYDGHLGSHNEVYPDGVPASMVGRDDGVGAPDEYEDPYESGVGEGHPGYGDYAPVEYGDGWNDSFRGRGGGRMRAGRPGFRGAPVMGRGRAGRMDAGVFTRGRRGFPLRGGIAGEGYGPLRGGPRGGRFPNVRGRGEERYGLGPPRMGGLDAAGELGGPPAMRGVRGRGFGPRGGRGAVMMAPGGVEGRDGQTPPPSVVRGGRGFPGMRGADRGRFPGSRGGLALPGGMSPIEPAGAKLKVSFVKVVGLSYFVRPESINEVLAPFPYQEFIIEAAPNNPEKRTGEGYIVFNSEEIAKAAIEKLTGMTLNYRKILLTACTEEQFLQCARIQPRASYKFALFPKPVKPPPDQFRWTNSGRCPASSEEHQQQQAEGNGAEGPGEEHGEGGGVRMSGLPTNVTDSMILDFFSDIGLIPSKIHLLMDETSHLPTGDAYCEFEGSGERASRAASGKDQKRIGPNLISVKVISQQDLAKALNLPPATEGNAKEENSEVSAEVEANSADSETQKEKNGPKESGNNSSKQQAESEVATNAPVKTNSDQDRQRGSEHQKRPAMASGPRAGDGRPPAAMRGGGRGGPRPLMSGAPPRTPLQDGPGLDGFGEPGCVVAVANVPPFANTDDLLAFFGKYPLTPDQVIRRYDSTGRPTSDARVAFCTPGHARDAVRALNRASLLDRPVFLSPVL